MEEEDEATANDDGATDTGIGRTREATRVRSGEAGRAADEILDR